MHPYANKKEAQAALTKARDKAQRASDAYRAAREMPRDENEEAVRFMDRQQIQIDAAHLHYKRCVAELEEAVNEYTNWDEDDNNA